MGSEQSQPTTSSGFGKIAQHPSYGRSVDGRGSGAPSSSRGAAAAAGASNSRSFDGGARRDRPRRTLSDESLSTITSAESRPVSPPMSVYSDSDLPYISYTDKPIGDSPSKGRNNKNQLANRLMRASTLATDRPSSSRQQQRQVTSAGKPGNRPDGGGGGGGHNIVIVRSGPAIPARHSDILKLQSIPQFLPVIRGTLSLPANRDPEVLERLQPVHLQNICSRIQVYMNDSANRVVAEQSEIYQKIRRVDLDVEKLQAANVEREKQYSQMAESFSKVRQIGHQLAKCNALLNQNLESLAELNELLPIEERLDAFVWKTD